MTTTPAWLRWTTRIALVLGAVALAITVHAVGVDALAGHLRSIGWWFGVLLAIEAASTLCEAGAIHQVARGSDGPTFRAVCVAQFAGRAVNSVTPGGNLGEALKVSLLARECPTPRAVAAIMFAALGSVIISLVIVAAGTLATAIAFDVPDAAQIALLITAAIATVAVTTLIVLVRRGMLVALARVARRTGLVSEARFERWSAQLAEIDQRLRGDGSRSRVGAGLLLVLAQLLQRASVWGAILATGYELGAPQVIAILSAGVVLQWMCSWVPLGIGVSEGGNGALFAAIGANPALGVALALAKRVNQIVFAALGFGILAADRLAHHIEEPAQHHVVPSAPTIPGDSGLA